MNKKTTGIIFIFCMIVYSTHASFIERVKNLQIRALIERDDLPLPSECTIAICSYLSFDEKKQLRVVCRKFEQYMHHYICVFPVKSLSDFLYFDYCMRSSGYLFRTQAKILCELQLPPIAEGGTDISVQVVLMKRDNYCGIHSVEEYKKILNRSFFINDPLKVYIFKRYKAEGKENIELYRFGMKNLLVISVLAEALRKKDIEVIPYMLLILFFLRSTFGLRNWVVNCINLRFKERAGSVWEEHSQLENKYSPFFCEEIKIHSLYPQDYLFLFINKNVPTLRVKDNNEWVVEMENILSLDTAEYKTLSEKFSSFTQTNSEKKVISVLQNVYLCKNFIASSLIRLQDPMKLFLYGLCGMYSVGIFIILSLTSIGIYYRYLQMISQLYPTMKKHPHRKRIFGGELIVDLFLYEVTVTVGETVIF